MSKLCCVSILLLFYAIQSFLLVSPLLAHPRKLENSSASEIIITCVQVGLGCPVRAEWNAELLFNKKKEKKERKRGKKMQLCPDTAFMELYSKPFNGFNRARFGPKRTISNALFNLVKNLFSWYCKRGWTDPYSDLRLSFIPRPSAMQLNKLIQLQGSQVQKGQ